LRTLWGATGTIDVAVEDWTPETLPAILEAKAETLDLAYNLG